MNGDLEFDSESINGLLRRAREKDRGYVSYWKWEIDRALEEVHVARELLAHLERHADWSVGSLRNCSVDPPDCEASLTDGRVLGIDVTELVDERVVERQAIRRSAERSGRPLSSKAVEPAEAALWIAPELRDRLRMIIARKDVAARGGIFDAYVVAIFTDETAVTPELFQEAMTEVCIETGFLDSAYNLFICTRCKAGLSLRDSSCKVACAKADWPVASHFTPSITN